MNLFIQRFCERGNGVDTDGLGIGKVVAKTQDGIIVASDGIFVGGRNVVVIAFGRRSQP